MFGIFRSVSPVVVVGALPFADAAAGFAPPVDVVSAFTPHGPQDKQATRSGLVRKFFCRTLSRSR